MGLAETTVSFPNITLPKYSACLECKKSKVKCDAARPKCCRCRASNKECEYVAFECRSKIRALQRKIKEMESKIQVIEQQRSSSPAVVRSSIDQGLDNVSTLGSRPALLSSKTSAKLPSCLLNGFDPLKAEIFLPTYPSPIDELALRTRPSAVDSRPPHSVIEKLLSAFMSRTLQAGFELHLGRVLQGLQPGSAEPVSPALIYAMVLIACHYTEERGLGVWENILLELTKREIEAATAQAYGGDARQCNPLHHLQAMLMLGQYFYFCGRMLEGYVHTTSTIQFAVALGIHRLNSRIFDSYKQSRSETTPKPAFGLKRWQPRDPIELGEAINLWWACASRDLAGSTLNGLPPVMPPDEITTVWPTPLSVFDEGQPLDDNYSAASLLDPKFSHLIADASYGGVFCILCKACVLMFTSGKLDMERISNPELTPEWWETFLRCDRAIERFLQTAPPVYTGINFAEAAFLATIHTTMNCCIIQLHSTWAECEFTPSTLRAPNSLWPGTAVGRRSYDRCVEACQKMALATAQTEHIDMTYMHMFIGATWIVAAEFLARNIPILKNEGLYDQAHEMQQQMMIMERAMERLLFVYPVLGLQAEKLRSLSVW